MGRFRIMADGCRHFDIEASCPKMAYSAVCCWFMPSKEVFVLDYNTKATTGFRRELSKDGVCERIIERE